MKYRVVFMERVDAEANPSENPAEYVELEAPDGVILDQVFVERVEPQSMHNQEVMDEDDSFNSIGTEVWEYDVADGREQEFINALKNSKMVMEYHEFDDVEMIQQGKSELGGSTARTLE
jgi:hypothetical protein